MDVPATYRAVRGLALDMGATSLGSDGVEDVVQEAMLELWRRETVGALTWRPGAVIDGLRRLTRSRRVCRPPRPLDVDQIDIIADGIPDPEDVCIQRDRRAWGVDVVDRLPRHLRRVVRWRCYDGLLLREIGDRLGVTEGRVCQMWGQALGRVERMTRMLREEAAP